MRTTLNLQEDALIAARNVARRECLSLGDAVSALIRRSAAAPDTDHAEQAASPLRGRFALLPARDELITSQHIRALMGT